MSGFLGIDVGGTNTKIVVVNDAFEVLERAEFPSDAASGPRKFGERLRAQLDSMSIDESEIKALGFSVAALVKNGGEISQAPNLASFEGLDMKSLVGDWKDRMPIVIENDVNCAIVGEHRCGAGRGAHDLCMFSLGTGVGGGVMIRGELVHGAQGLAGELGHMVLSHDGPLCACGLPGHVESYLSTAAIVERASGALANAGDSAGILAAAIAAGARPSPRILAECASKGCSLSWELLAECGRWLGIACSNIAHALQPERILIGGGVSRAGDLLLSPAREEFEARSMRAVRGTVELRVAELGVDGAAIGAAVLASDLLDD